MKNKLSSLLKAAVMTGLIAGSIAKADESTTEKQGDQVTAEKNKCKGEKAEGKNTCKGQKSMKKKKNTKNTCSNGCGESKEKSEKTESTEHKDK